MSAFASHGLGPAGDREDKYRMKKSKTKQSLPEHLIELLIGGHAHVDFEKAVEDWPSNLQGKKPDGAAHSPWEVLEHMRIAQWDILEFTRNPKHVSPEFPAGYWPKTQAPPDGKAWSKTLSAFRSDLKAMIKIVQSKSTDFYTPLPHGDGQTVLREALLLADHNAYHLGELLLLRRLLGAWK
jgi:DinB family protein